MRGPGLHLELIDQRRISFLFFQLCTVVQLKGPEGRVRKLVANTEDASRRLTIFTQVRQTVKTDRVCFINV